MKILFTVELENRHQAEAGLLEACVRDGVTAFNRRIGHSAIVWDVRLVSDDAAHLMLGRGSPYKRA